MIREMIGSGIGAFVCALFSISCVGSRQVPLMRIECESASGWQQYYVERVQQEDARGESIVSIVGGEDTNFVEGIEGSPVFSGSEHIGAVLSLIGKGEGRLAQVLSISALRAMLSAPRVNFKPLGAAQQRSSEVALGDTVSLVKWWGTYSSIGDVGSVAFITNVDCVCIIPRESFGSGRDWGPCCYALCRAPVVGSGRNEGRSCKVTAPGDVLGTAYYQTEDGVLALLGSSPPVTLLTVRVVDARRTPRELVFHVVADRLYWGKWVGECINSVLQDVVVAPEQALTVSLEISELDSVKLATSGTWGSQWKVPVRQFVESELSKAPPGPILLNIVAKE